jgi:hypothetical protein
MMYVIIPTSDITDSMMKKSTSTDLSTCRKSVDGSLVVLEIYEMSYDFFNYQIYSKDDIIAIMGTSTWDPTISPPGFFKRLFNR